MKLDELIARVATRKKSLPSDPAARAAAINAVLRNNAVRGVRDSSGRASGKLSNKTPRAPRAPQP